jgi:rhodanese-related sulfurtransferase
MISEISALELSQRLAQPNPPAIIDVREPDEFEYAHIAGAQLKPLGDIEQWAGELDRDGEYVLQCHSGSRSAYATNYLQSLGFKHVANLRGGIDAWSRLVDPDIPRY